MTDSDPNRPFNLADANVGYRIAKRPSICRDQLGINPEGEFEEAFTQQGNAEEITSGIRKHL